MEQRRRDPREQRRAGFVRQYKVALRLGVLQRHLETHDFLLDRFSVADAYLVTVLNRAPHAGVDLAAWPAVHAYARRMLQRPSVAKAVADELALYRKEAAKRP
ncbi:glutathione binding-like protein [Paraburkholderia caballeronis]|uniref:Glutathione S-transferase n=1 Tax=Paraburkholderia caballeronis TaxID=416943 RepID=A0A1H7QFA3_9BURK|nr:glutathione binding-like protein [Paraburkholderia caballeronis]PXW22582.1 glutathione S-transferase-like protein [Paraburkholderia caballeronis]PXW96453.1 glutathione S-transferase-like protein [Paraburkholderia caballeronis]RAJ92864.1 glutathione S-transferase-like protein [Paraburkholderia caballeronis]SEL46770.1 glutathione S-transferase [Paraburkholderia caballeronis]